MGWCRRIAFGGLFVALTGGAMAWAADKPAMPATAHSAPAEQATTEQLNYAAAKEAAHANQAAADANAQAQQRYESQQKDYLAAKQKYADEMARYHADRARYDAEYAHNQQSQ